MTDIIYAPDVIFDEVFDNITTVLTGITLPKEDGTTGAINIIEGVVPDNSIQAPYIAIDILSGIGGEYSKIGEDDVIVIGIQICLYCAQPSDTRWLSRIAYLIQRKLSESEWYSGKMLKRDQPQIKSKWEKVFSELTQYPIQFALLEHSYNLPNPDQMQIINSQNNTP
jgi:hypothetical protein